MRYTTFPCPLVPHMAGGPPLLNKGGEELTYYFRQEIPFVEGEVKVQVMTKMV